MHTPLLPTTILALGFAIAVSALLASALAARGQRREAALAWPAFALIVWLHPVMDLLSGGGPSVALFWPLWSHSFHPVAGGLPLHSYTTSVGGLFGLLFDPGTLWGMLVEAAVFGPLFAATIVQRRSLEIALGAIGALIWISLAVFSPG